MKKTFILFLAIVTYNFSFAQEIQKLNRLITNPVEQEIAPVISADGKHLLFMLKGSHGRGWGLQYSVKQGREFQRGTSLDEINLSEKLNLMGGYCLNADGSELYFTSKKHGGIGNYDIWKASRKADGTFGNLENLGKPVNTAGNEGAPSISADGKYLYFMTSASMDDEQNIQGEIWVSERRGQFWGQAQKLPIGTGYSYPKIFPSNNYLLLTKASNGVIEFFYAKKVNGQWQTPQKIESLSGKINQPFASISQYEKSIFFSSKDENSSDLCQGMLAQKEQPTPLIVCRYVNQKTTEKAQIIVNELGKNEQLVKELITHSLDFYLETGKKYDVYVQNLATDELFYHEIIDGTKYNTLTFEKRDLVFQKIAIGDTLNWTNYADDENYQIVFVSPQKAQQLVSFLNKSPFKYEFIKEVNVELQETAINSEGISEKLFVEMFLDELIKQGLSKEKYQLKTVQKENPRDEIMLHVIGK